MPKTRYCTLCHREVATRKLSTAGIVIGMAFLIVSAFTGIGFILGLLIFGLVCLAAADKCQICGSTALTVAPHKRKPIRNHLGEIKSSQD